MSSSAKKTFFEVKPALILEWHPTKNGSLSIHNVSYGSVKKIWWKCKKGHEWQATALSRTYGSGCPFCSGKSVCRDNCLATVNPQLAAEWHHTKNGNLTPNDITAGSNKRVWWVCNKGHEWQATVLTRKYGFGCPYCSRMFASKETCLQTVNPVLAQEWHPVKNGRLTPYDVLPGSNKKFWWLCKKGHEYQASVVSRKNGKMCPYCSGRLVCEDNCLATINPLVAAEWHPFRNAPLMAKDILFNSAKKIWWQCEKGHEWQAMPYHRNKGTKCPYCSGNKVCEENSLQSRNPSLASEWHPSRNGALTPDGVTAKSNRKVWWQCKEGHEWRAKILNRSIHQSSCPYCVGKSAGDDNCLQAINPELAKEWHPTRNLPLTPFDVTSGSGKKVWWKCKKGHEWLARIGPRNRGIGCPYCAPSTSGIELRIYSELKRIFRTIYHRKKIHGMECDIFIPDLKLAIEIDGYIWHKDKLQTDKNKLKILQQNNVALLRMRESGLKQISENDIFFKKDEEHLPIVKRILKAILKTTEIPSRHEEKIRQFLKNNQFLNAEEYHKLLKLLPGPLPGTSLSECEPEISKQWHPVKNGILSPNDVTVGSHMKVWWLCNRGHEWESTIKDRTGRNSYCPFCSGAKAHSANCLQTLNPVLAQEWHPSKNGDMTPKDVSPSSSRKAWWKCQKGHEWQAVIHSRHTGRGCPYCSGRLVSKDNCLQVKNPRLASEWHPTKNGNMTPHDVLPASHKKAWWQCEKGHEWQAVIASRNAGRNCPYCFGKANWEKKNIYKVLVS